MILPAELRLSSAGMDREHAEVHQVVAEFCSVVNSSVPNAQLLSRLLSKLTDTVAAHFASEEELMETHGYQGLQAHAAEHRRLLGQLDLVRTGLEAGVIKPSGTLALFVEEWIKRHILGPDQAFAEYIKTEGRGAAVQIWMRNRAVRTGA
jgi:hemerythrin